MQTERDTRHTSNLCLRAQRMADATSSTALHSQCVAQFCECPCHVKPAQAAKRKGAATAPARVSARRGLRAIRTPEDPPMVHPLVSDGAEVAPADGFCDPGSPDLAMEFVGPGAPGVWEDPPSRKRLIIPPAERVLIDANPGRWRRVRTYRGEGARSARIRLLRSGEVAGPYEVKSSVLPNHHSGLYVRRKPT